MALYKVIERNFKGEIVTHGEALQYDKAYSMFIEFSDAQNANYDVDEVMSGEQLESEYEGGQCWIKIEEDDSH